MLFATFRCMRPIEAAIWGLAGGACVESLELYVRIRRTSHWNWRRPIPQSMAAYVISVVIRVGVGAALAAASAGSGQVSGSLAAFGLGIAAPLVIERLARAVPLATAAGDPRVPSVAADPTGISNAEPPSPVGVESTWESEADNAR